MKKLRNAITIVLILTSIFVNTLNVSAYKEIAIPDNIKIGLFFESTGKSILEIESVSGFTLARLEDDKLIDLFDIEENKITLKILDANLIEDLYNKGDKAAYSDDGDKGSKPYELDNIYNDIKINDLHRIEDGYHIQVLDENRHNMFVYDSQDQIYFKAMEGRNDLPLIKVEGENYRGSIGAKRIANSNMTIINHLPLEEYLYGVVPNEMSPSWPEEALKAQAIAARGFTVSNLNKYSRLGFNLCKTTNSQVYKGYNTEHVNTNRAVDSTKSQILTYEGKVVEPYYHSNSGGRTEDSENVWVNYLPYIRGIEDEFSMDSPNSNWEKSFTKSEIETILVNNNIHIGELISIEITSLSKNDRVMSLSVKGSLGEKVFKKQESRSIFGLRSNYFSIKSNNNSQNNIVEKDSNLYVQNVNDRKSQNIDLNNKNVITKDGVYNLKSENNKVLFNGYDFKEVITQTITINPTSDKFEFIGKGYGHGLGMSQYGAKKMAEENYNYEDILKYYYTGVKVE